MDCPLQVTEFRSFFHSYHKSNYTFDGHTHSALELYYVADGELETTYDDQLITLKKNMLIIYENDVFHRSRVLSDNGAETFAFHFYSVDIPHQKHARVYELSENNTALIKLLIEEAEKNKMKYDNSNAIYSKNLNYQAEKLLEVLLIRLINDQNIVDIKQHPDQKIFKAAINYLKENINKNLTIDDVSKTCHISNTKLKNVFKYFTGNGVMTHFSDMRINTVKKLIDEGYSIGEISERMGYSSQAYLCTCFKKKIGISPIQYKKMQRDNVLFLNLN